MPLERLVIVLGKSRKIVLFIVEGVTDEISLGLVLSTIIKTHSEAKFKIIPGDLFGIEKSNEHNILQNITKVIKDFIDSDIYKKSDILEVVHLIDTDGTFIEDNLINSHQYDKIQYNVDGISTMDVDYIKCRNFERSKSINRVINVGNVYVSIPYKLYYFSCNLEHVLHNSQNTSKEEKLTLACRFEDRYAENALLFYEFINNSDIHCQLGYTESWEFIKAGNNSLKRYTNLANYLSKYFSGV